MRPKDRRAVWQSSTKYCADAICCFVLDWGTCSKTTSTSISTSTSTSTSSSISCRWWSTSLTSNISHSMHTIFIHTLQQLDQFTYLSILFLFLSLFIPNLNWKRLLAIQWQLIFVSYVYVCLYTTIDQDLLTFFISSSNNFLDHFIYMNLLSGFLSGAATPHQPSDWIINFFFVFYLYYLLNYFCNTCCATI